MTSRIDSIKARLAAANDGPWDYREGLGWCDLHTHPYLHNKGTHLKNGCSDLFTDDDYKTFKANLKLIANCPKDLADLIKAYEVTRQALVETIDEIDRDYKFVGVTAREALAEADEILGGNVAEK